MFDQNPTYHFESDIDTEEHVLLETRVVDLSTVTISQDEAGLLVVTRNVEAEKLLVPADDDDDEAPAVGPKYRLEPEGDLFRIVALRNIGRNHIYDGDRGGLVSSSYILAQTGDCWIGRDSKATGNVYVREDAHIYGNSVVSDSTLEGSISVSGDARLNNCKITTAGNSHLHLHGVASFDESRIELASGQNMYIPAGCVTGAHIRNRFELVSFYTGPRFGWLDAFRGKDGDQRFTIGCQDHGSPDEIRELARDYSITDVETAMLEGFLALADAARGGWLPEPAATKSGAAPDVAVLSQYGEDLSRDITF